MTLEALRTEIRARFGSEAAFARIINLRRQVFHHYMTAERTPPIGVILRMTELLDLSAEELIRIFLAARSPNGQN